MSRILGLDGLRGLAILMVLLSHASNILLGGQEGLLLYYAHALGRAGVMVFFVLSGYLITRILLNDMSQYGAVSIPHFWLKRCIRIFPVFYTYLLVVLALVSFGILDIPRADYILAATYISNYSFFFCDPQINHSDYAVLVHFWSLAVEEQFYIFFPLLFVFLSPRYVQRCLWVLVCVTPIVRVGQYYLFPESRGYIGVMGHTMFGATIAWGCLLACCESTGTYKRLRKMVAHPFVFGLAVLIALLIAPILSIIVGGTWTVPVGDSIAGLSSLCILAYSLSERPVRWRRMLLSNILRRLGLISYSLYVWQQLFFFGHIELHGRQMTATEALISSLAVATFSYFVIECTSHAVRRKLIRERTPLAAS